ncbi:hypothetical protein VTN31DRAFT_7368 [Thermomyces dupontii]|uniref:uncharacterized protein n=1 Tax=Talaromyces thermophilus TaxID=28565 RepID=UPI0037435264
MFTRAPWRTRNETVAYVLIGQWSMKTAHDTRLARLGQSLPRIGRRHSAGVRYKHVSSSAHESHVGSQYIFSNYTVPFIAEASMQSVTLSFPVTLLQHGPLRSIPLYRLHQGSIDVFGHQEADTWMIDSMTV